MKPSSKSFLFFDPSDLSSIKISNSSSGGSLAFTIITFLSLILSNFMKIKLKLS